jgi:transposase
MGVLDRLILRDDQWERMARHVIGDERTRGSSGRNNRMFVEAVLWIVRTGSPWRDLPDVFGHGTASFAGSADGAPKAYGTASSRPWLTMATSNT